MNQPTVPAPAMTPVPAMLRTLGLVSALCGLIIVGAYQGTFNAVAANKRLAVERSVYKVIPAAKSIEEYRALPGGGIEPATGGKATDGAIPFFAAYDGDGKLIGVAAEASSRGYADQVRIMFAYRPECQCITGVGVVAMRETPGIGDKIVSNKDFLANFEKLDVRLKEDLSTLANEVVTVKHGTKAYPWQIDAIAGATITSRAVGRGINAAAATLLPKLVPHLDKLKRTPPTTDPRS